MTGGKTESAVSGIVVTLLMGRLNFDHCLLEMHPDLVQGVDVDVVAVEDTKEIVIAMITVARIMGTMEPQALE